MARPAKFTDDDLLDAACSSVHTHGRDATIGQIAASAGAPVGSIYHRFGSREELLIRLWIREIRTFQRGLFKPDGSPDAAHALESAAVHVVRYCREHPAQAFALTLYRQKVAAAQAPAEVADEVRHLNDDVLETMTHLTRSYYGRATQHRLDVVRTACQQSPYGLVRPYVGRRDQTAAVPAWLDDAVRVSTRAILGVGGPAKG
ncbi:TetR/AcrR family transcriptional regulator [Flexivirga sp. B27]